jgi:hypothetical protein
MMSERIPTTSRPGWGRVDAEHDIADAGRVLGHPLLVEVLAAWQRLPRKGPLPAREDLDELILKPGLFPQIVLAEGVERDGRRDVRYRLIGTGLANEFGQDMTGRYVRDVFADPVYAEELISAVYLVIDRRQPIATTGRFVSDPPAGAPVMVYRLGLPLAKLPSGTPLMLACQFCVDDGRIVEHPTRATTVYEPIEVIALVERAAG